MRDQLSVENAMAISATEITEAMEASDSVYAEQGIFYSFLRRCSLRKKLLGNFQGSNEVYGGGGSNSRWRPWRNLARTSVCIRFTGGAALKARRLERFASRPATPNR